MRIFEKMTKTKAKNYHLISGGNSINANYFEGSVEDMKSLNKFFMAVIRR